MQIEAMAPSPVARLLLELEEREATGAVDVGDRRVVLTKGAVTDVRPAEGDVSLGPFLVASGRLTQAQLLQIEREAAEGTSHAEHLLVRHGLATSEVLTDARRALWLDRIVQGLRREEEQGLEPGSLVPETQAGAGPPVALLPIVLDALARRAGFGDAEQVGRHSHAWLEWFEVPQYKRAVRWADFGEVPQVVAISQVLTRHPAAASRIAALVRAGLGRLTETKASVPPPPPRNPSIAAPAPARRTTSVPPPPAPAVPADLASVPPAAPAPDAAGALASAAPVSGGEASGESRPPAEQLAPGLVRTATRPIGIEPVESSLPTSTGRLDDPLDPLERKLGALEQSAAPGPERALVWLEVARIWQHHYDSVEEAARAAREAAAADPHNLAVLETAARLCATCGESQLAYSYERVAADRVEDPTRRARILGRAADYATRADKPGSALRALRDACEGDAEEPSVLERYSRALSERGEYGQAAEVARRAAGAYQDRSTELARAVLARALGAAPDDADLAADYAQALSHDGFAEAAVAVLSRTARGVNDSEQRERLWLDAARRANAAARPDMTAQLLLEALDEDPTRTSVYEPLVLALETTGSAVDVALVAREIAEACEHDQRAAWLLRAAEARLELPGDPQEAFELFAEALCADPYCERALEVLRDESESQDNPKLLADAIERALRQTDAPNPAGLKLANMLVDLSTARMSTPGITRWAWEQRVRHGGAGPNPGDQEDLERALSDWDRKAEDIKTEFTTASEEEQTGIALRLAAMLRDDPALRPRARQIYGEVLAADSANEAALDGLEEILRVEQDLDALQALWMRRLGGIQNPARRIAQRMECARVAANKGELRVALDHCLVLLEAAPKHREAIVLMGRVARRAGDLRMYREALTRRMGATLDPRERSRVLATLARVCARAGALEEAIKHAQTALAADPRAADAALLLMDHADALRTGSAVGVLKAARGALGDSPRLLTLLARACMADGKVSDQQKALQALARVCPFDPAPALELLALHVKGTDTAAISDAAHAVLAPERRSPQTPDAVLSAARRLDELDALSDALTLALTAADAVGQGTGALLSWAEGRAREASDPRLTLACIERQIARAKGKARADALRRLAQHHRQQSNPAAEARAYLRLLALEPASPEALERLVQIYGAAREAERLLSLLTLRLDLSPDDSTRRLRLMELAEATLALADDPSGAQELVMAALATEDDDEGKPGEPDLDTLRRAVGTVLNHAPQLAFDILLELAPTSSEERSSMLVEEAAQLAEQRLENPDLGLRAAVAGLELHPTHTNLLLHFERLALELGDVATGREVYRALADAAAGDHGRRAVLYRAARWLERAGDDRAALEAYAEAFQLAPSAGVVFQSIERLAHEQRHFGPLAAALVRLGEQASLPERRAELFGRAAGLYADEMGEVQAGFELYERSFRAVPDDEVEIAALRAARRLADKDAQASHDAFETWRELLTEQADESWDSTAKVAALVRLGRLELEAFEQRDRASEIADLARNALDADDDKGDGERGELLSTIAELLARIPERLDDALETVQVAISLAPGAPRASALHQHLTSLPPAMFSRPPSKGPTIPPNNPLSSTLVGIPRVELRGAIPPSSQSPAPKTSTPAPQAEAVEVKPVPREAERPPAMEESQQAADAAEAEQNAADAEDAPKPEVEGFKPNLPATSASRVPKTTARMQLGVPDNSQRPLASAAPAPAATAPPAAPAPAATLNEDSVVARPLTHPPSHSDAPYSPDARLSHHPEPVPYYEGNRQAAASPRTTTDPGIAPTRDSERARAQAQSEAVPAAAPIPAESRFPSATDVTDEQSAAEASASSAFGTVAPQPSVASEPPTAQPSAEPSLTGAVQPAATAPPPVPVAASAPAFSQSASPVEGSAAVADSDPPRPSLQERLRQTQDGFGDPSFPKRSEKPVGSISRSIRVTSSLLPPVLAAPESAPPPKRPPAEEPSAPAELSPLGRAASGDEQAIAEMLESVGDDAARAQTRAHDLLGQLEGQSITVATVRALHKLAVLGGMRAVSQVSTELLAHVDSSVTAAQGARELDPGEPALRRALEAARAQGDWESCFSMMRLAWEGAAPLFKRTLQSVGASANDWLSGRENNAHSAALGQTLHLLAAQTDVYWRHTGQDRVQAVCTQPPTVLLGDGVPPDGDALRFRFGAAFELCQPDTVLLATLPPEVARTLLAAIRAAFGPTDATSPVPREAAAQAAELWRTMPSALQREVSSLFRVAQQPLDYETMQKRVTARAARVGLISSGRLDVTLACLGTDLAPGDTPVATEAATFDEQAAAPGLLSDTLHFALSEPYLMLREAAGG